LKKRCIALFVIIITFNLFVYGQQKINVTESFGDRLVIGMIAEPSYQLNPYQITSSSQLELVNMVFGYGLLQKPGKYAISSSLLDRIIYDTERSNNKIWRIVLNRNIVFHDGSLLLNSDVKFTYDLLKKYGGSILNRRIDLQNIKNVSINGDLEVVFELYKSDPAFYEKFSDIPIISREYYESAMAIGYSIFSEKPPMGLGPFSFNSRSNNELNLKYHQLYFSGRPFLGDINIKFFENEEQVIDALANKNVDYIEIEDRITAQRLHDLMGSNIIVFSVPRPNNKVYFILANLRRLPLSDVNVRKAIELSINRDEISDKFDFKEIARTLFDSQNPHYFKNAFREDEFNPALASQILRNSGWRPDQKTGILQKNNEFLDLKLSFAKNSFLEENIARTLKISLGDLNINLQPIPVLQAQKEEILKKGGFDLMVMSYTYNPQYLFDAVEQFYFDILKGNLSDPSYQNSYLDQLINLSYRDKSIQEKLYQRFQYYLKREVPAFFLFFDQRIIVAINSRFHNFRTTFRENDRFYMRMAPLENWFVPKVLQKYSQ
jgi:ABC-type transport system substrate-binding protein